MGRRLIVDGHNLALSGAVPLSSDPGGAEGRDELCALVAGYARGKGFGLTVVFDGRGAGRADRSRTAFKGGTAVYSSRSETADDVIREMSFGAPSGTIVVTSDRGLAGTLSARDIAVVSCEEFGRLLHEKWIESVKGGPEDDAPPARAGKKGEGRRLKKRERRKDALLRKL